MSATAFLALLPLTTVALAQGDTLAGALDARDASTVVAWADAHPERVPSTVRGRIDAWLAAPDREVLADELAFVRTALDDRPVGELLARVLGWSVDERGSFEMLRADLASGALELETALVEAEALGAEPLLLREVGAKAQAAYLANDLATGLEIMTWVGREAARAHDIPAEAWAANWRAQVEWIRGDFERAAAHLEHAAELEEVLGDDVLRVRQYADLSRISASRGRIDEALRWAKSAEALARTTGDDEALCEALIVRAGIHVDLGEHERALELSLDIAPAKGGGVARAGTLVRADMLTAGALSDIGRFESALVFATRALENATSPEVERTMPLLVLEARLILGLLLGDLGRYDEGLEQLERARAFAIERGEGRGAAWADKNEGWIRLARGERERAAEAFERARAYGASIGDVSLEGLAALGVAEALVLDATSDEAYDAERVAALLARAETIGAQLGDLEILWRIAAVRGRQASLRRDDEGALAFYGRAVADVERWRRRLASPALLVHALRPRTDPYVEAAFSAARLGRDEEALRFAELLHARTLFELRASDVAPRADDAEVEALRARIARLAFRMRAGLETEDEAAQRARAEDELDARLLEAEVARGPRFRAGDGAAGAAWRTALAESEVDVVLDFLVGRRETLVFALSASGIRAHLADVGEGELGARVRSVREPIELLQRGEVDLAHLAFDARAARALYDVLVAPALPDDLPADAVLAIVPDGSLTSLPFELLVRDGAPGAYDPARPFAHLRGLDFLGDDQALVYLSSLASLAVRPERAPIEGVLVVEPPREVGVPFAEDERAAIGESFGRERITLFADATPARLARRVDSGTRGSVLHFTAHGVLDAQHPARGHLLLGGEGDAPEALAAWQVESLALEENLVVLSACHTAEGAWLPGEGLLGLTRAFLAAGANEVVASLWAVDDRATVAFMRSFYAGLARGDSTSRALLAARNDTRDRVGAHPFLWAAWIVRR